MPWTEANKENIPPEYEDHSNLKKTCDESNIVVHDDSTAIPIELAADENGAVDESLLQLANLIAAADPSLMENWDSSVQYAITYDEQGQLSFQKEPTTHVGTPYPSKGRCTDGQNTSAISDTQTLTPECRVLFLLRSCSLTNQMYYRYSSTTLLTPNNQQ